MSDQIRADDIFDPNLYKGVISDAKIYNDSLKKTTELFNQMLSIQKNISGNKLNDSQDYKAMNKDLATSLILEQKYQQEKIKTEKIVIDASIRQIKLEKDKEAALKKTNIEQEKQTKEQIKSQSAYYRLSQELLKNKKAVKDLLAAGKELSDVDKKLIKDTQELDKRLKEIDGTVGDNQRNVGAYKEALNDAAAELGAFGGGISRVIRTLKEIQKENKEATTGTQKFGNVMKAVGAGIVLAGVLALVKGLEGVKDASLSASNAMEKLSAQTNATLIGTFNLSANAARKAAGAYIEALQAYRIEARNLELELQKLTFEEEEQNRIANDATIGFKERNEALQKGIEISKERSEKEVQIAKVALNNVNQEIAAIEIAVGAGNYNNELRDKQLEATKKLNEALHQQGELEQENAKKQRQFASEQTNQAIDLILKKREAYNQEKHILEEQIKDEKIQLDEREKDAQKLLSVNKKTTDEELKLFKDGYQIKFNSNELLKEQDAVILADKIKNLKTLDGHGLGEAGVMELAKIIKQAQENEISNNEIIKKQKEERQKSDERIAQIDKEIAIIGLQNQANSTKLEIERAKIKYGDRKTGGNFNSIKSELGLELDYQKEIVRQQAEIDIQATKNKHLRKEEEAKEIEKINANMYKSLTELDLEYTKTTEELDKERKEFLRKQLVEELNTTIDFTQQALERKSKLQQQYFDNDLDMRQRNIIQQQQLAEQGYANTLAFEKAAAAKDELEKQQLAIREQKREKAVAFLKLFAAYAEKGDPDQALSKTLIQMAIAGAIAGSYYDGTENVAEDLKGNKVHGGKDGYLIAVDGKERIMNPKQNAMIGSMNNDDLAQLAYNYQNGYIPLGLTDQGSFAQNVSNSIMIGQLNKFIEKASAIEKAINNKPVSSINIDKNGVVSKSEFKNGLTKVRTYKSSPLNYI